VHELLVTENREGVSSYGEGIAGFAIQEIRTLVLEKYVWLARTETFSQNGNT
jgi:hypothetical protein